MITWRFHSLSWFPGLRVNGNWGIQCPTGVVGVVHVVFFPNGNRFGCGQLGESRVQDLIRVYCDDYYYFWRVWRIFDVWNVAAAIGNVQPPRRQLLKLVDFGDAYLVKFNCNFADTITSSSRRLVLNVQLIWRNFNNILCQKIDGENGKCCDRAPFFFFITKSSTLAIDISSNSIVIKLM